MMFSGSSPVRDERNIDNQKVDVVERVDSLAYRDLTLSG